MSEHLEDTLSEYLDWLRDYKHQDNAAKYGGEDVKKIKSRINAAAQKHGIEISKD